MTPDEMKDLKTQRSSLKAKVKTSATRLQKGITNNKTESSLQICYNEVESAYLEFTAVDVAYSDAILNDNTLEEEFGTVNQMNCQQYSDAVEENYTTVIKNYDEYVLAKTSKAVEDLRVELDRLWDKIRREEEATRIERNLKRVEITVSQISVLKEKKADHQSVDWDPLTGDIDDILSKNEELEDEVSERLHRIKESVQPPPSSLPGSNAQVPGSPIMSTGFSMLPVPAMSSHSQPITSMFSQLQLQPPASMYPMSVYSQSIPSPYQLPSQSLPMSMHHMSTSAQLTSSSNQQMFAQSSPLMPTSTSLPPHSVFPPLTSLPPSSLLASSSSLLPPTFTNPTIPASTMGPQQPLQPIHPQQPSQPIHPHVKVRKSELPKFSGQRQDWPEFQCIWPKLAIPAFPSRETLALELRTCCKGGLAEPILRNIAVTGPGAFDEMWRRLTDHYGDDAASVNEILRKLQNLKYIRPEDYKALIEFTNKIEGCYSQLSSLNQLECISMLQVDNLAALLPTTAREVWHELYQRLSPSDKLHPFRAFASYLVSKRKDVSRLAEQQSTVNKRKEISTHHTDARQEGEPHVKEVSKVSKPNCAVCQRSGGHKTDVCFAFKKMTRDEKISVLKEVYACFRCFLYHQRGKCVYKKPCENCGKTGHNTLLCLSKKDESVTPSQSSSSPSSEPIPSKTGNTAHTTLQRSSGLYAIFSAAVVESKRMCTVFTDDGSDTSFITNSAAKRLGARRLKRYNLEVRTTGGNIMTQESQEYELKFITKSGKIVPVRMFGMDMISGTLTLLNLTVLSKLFPDYDPTLLQRQSTEVDVLMGTDYFGLHPKNEVCTVDENLSIMEGPLGICVQGSHPMIATEDTITSNMADMKVADIQIKNTHLTSARPLTSVQHPFFSQSHFSKSTSLEVEKYIKGEEIGTQSTPKCGSCRCTTCPLPGHTYSFQEEAELKLIRDGLRYDEDNKCWISRYPWKFDPKTLPDNKSATMGTLRSLERRLQKNETLAQTYHEQVLDMVSRGAARKVTPDELVTYKGPTFYISHLGVPNPKSKSTPYRIVFNSSQRFKGMSLNDHLYKGPDSYINNQLGVLLKWRENHVGLVGDIKKMYNSVHLEYEEQHCHRFFWTNLKFGSDPETYVMTRVNMGDKPAGAISTEALYKTADMFKNENPAAAELLKNGSYVDDVLGSAKSKKAAEDLCGGADSILEKGGFKIKYWLMSGEKSGENGVTEVLGVGWISDRDKVTFQASLNFSPKKHGVHILLDLTADEVPAAIPDLLTKRMVLSQVMRIYDPMGLICAFTLRGKILLRETWEENYQWDEPLPEALRLRWVKFLCSVYDLRKLEYPRSIKPKEAEGNPTLVLFSDASDKAYGFMAYARWKCSNETYQSRLIMAKNRVAPLVKRTTPQLELNAAVLSKRGRAVIEKEMTYKFDRVLHLTDSQTVILMLQNLSTRYKLYEGVRVGEVQAPPGDISEWAWVAGRLNTSDWLTRGRDPEELSENSEWFVGAEFLAKPIEEWDIQFKPSSNIPIPGEKKAVEVNVVICSNPPINYMQFNSYRKMIRTVARILNMFQKKKLDHPDTTLLEESEILIIKDVQQSIKEECEKQHRGKIGGKYYRFRPTLVKGCWKIGTRLSFNPMVPDDEPQYLLPTDHRVTHLAMLQAHKDSSHRSRDSTLARFRQKFWALQGPRLANTVINNCLLCRRRKPKILSQIMGKLPEERTRPSPAWTYCMCDYFGPMYVRGEVQKRTTGKAWGIIITDLVSRAVHLEAVFEYGTDPFLVAFSKFVNIRGYPRKMYSDPGPNLAAASRELAEAWESMWQGSNKEKIVSKAAENGMDWILHAADAPWQNGAVESLVKSVKKCINISMQNQRLTPTEFSAVLYEAMNTVNERPIGVVSYDSELSILTPNSLLLGRSVAKNPGGWHPTSSTLERFHLVQTVNSTFWSSWMKIATPALVINEKWQVTKRNLQPGDIVLIMDKGVMRAEYRLGYVEEVYPGNDGLVRNAKISYRHYKVGDVGVKYTGSIKQFVIRPVQRLVMILPVEDREN